MSSRCVIAGTAVSSILSMSPVSQAAAIFRQ